jgi:hypothetical protein
VAVPGLSQRASFLTRSFSPFQPMRKGLFVFLIKKQKMLNFNVVRKCLSDWVGKESSIKK